MKEDNENQKKICKPERYVFFCFFEFVACLVEGIHKSLKVFFGTRIGRCVSCVLLCYDEPFDGFRCFFQAVINE